MQLRALLLLASGILSSSCTPGDTPGFIALSLTRQENGAITRTTIKGPALVRRLSGTGFVVVARVVAPATAGLSRGDLFLHFTLAEPIIGAGYFYGPPQSFQAQYHEVRGAGQAPVVFGAQATGSLKTELQGRLVNIAFDVPLTQASSTTLLRVTGVVGTGAAFANGRVAARDFGDGVWHEPFDPDVVVERPEYDFEVYADSSQHPEAIWVDDPAPEGPPTYGSFDFGTGGTITGESTSGGGGSSGGPDELPAEDAGCGGGGGGGSSDDSSGCGGGGSSDSQDSSSGCGKSSSDSSAKPRAGESSSAAPKCSAASLRPRGLGFLVVVLLIIYRRHRHRRSLRKRE